MVGGTCGALVYDFVFSIAAADRGCSACISSRKYNAVKTEEKKEAIEDLAGSTEFGGSLPPKLPLSSSFEKIASV